MLRYLCLRPLAPTAIALKGIYWQCVAAMVVGERVRERGQNRARFRPLSLTLSPIHLPSKSSRLRDLCRGKWMGARGRSARNAQHQKAPANEAPGFPSLALQASRNEAPTILDESEYLVRAISASFFANGLKSEAEVVCFTNAWKVPISPNIH